jgi:hypothetical protein
MIRRSVFIPLGLGLLLGAGFAAPAFAEKCPFSAATDPHERDENDPPLKCRKCEEIAEKIAHKDANVWTLDLKYGKPRRVEVKREAKNSEVYWFIHYEVTNVDTVPRPCFIDVTAESDKGRNTYTYHDSAVPEVVEEARRILGLKESETLYTQVDLCMPGPDSEGKRLENRLPNKDGTVLELTDQSGKPLVDSRSGKPAFSRFIDRDGVVKDGPAKIAFSLIQPGETRKCVAIFQQLDAEMDVLTIYFQGLTNAVDALNPEAVPVGEGDFRIVNDELKANDPDHPYRRKVIDRLFVLEYECLGDEFSKSSRSIKPHEEQRVRPVNLSKDETDPVRYHDVGVFGTEIVEPEEKTIEGRKTVPFTFLARKWIQVERTIKSDLR